MAALLGFSVVGLLVLKEMKRAKDASKSYYTNNTYKNGPTDRTLASELEC